MTSCKFCWYKVKTLCFHEVFTAGCYVLQLLPIAKEPKNYNTGKEVATLCQEITWHVTSSIKLALLFFNFKTEMC